jgi:hypothetical protein
MTWPPTLDALKLDAKVKDADTRDDERYQANLDAAVSFVERARPRFNYTADPASSFPDPTPDLILGTIRLAARWYSRAKSPEGVISLGELGTSRVSSFDPDIDRLLRIGRHAPPVVG